MEDLLASEEEEEESREDLAKYGDFQIANIVSENHLEVDMTEDSWLINWGKVSDSIGHIQVKAMWLFADLAISDTLIQEVGYVDAYVQTFHQMYEGTYVEKELEGVNSIMDRVMNDLSDMESIVIDVRFNGGGQDAVSFAILSRFIPNNLQIATQKLYFDHQYSSTIPLRIQGRPDAFTGSVFVLTSPQTGSAAESFSLATIAMDNAKRIGSPTTGAMSTALEKTLPNGWAFSISNELFMDNEGVNY